MTRICRICNIEKDLNESAINGKYIKLTCKQCESIRVNQLIKQTSDYVKSLKIKCEICGYNRNRSALEFHHVDGDDKELNIARFANSRIWSSKTKKIIDNEIKKCKCLCANCHRELHHPEDNMASS